MSVSQNLLPDYFEFIDSHLSLRILDFLLEKENDSNNSETLLNVKKSLLLKTKLYDQILKFFEENPKLSSDEEIKKIIEGKNNLISEEDNLKDIIVGFLNIVNNIKNDTNFDFHSPINRKIVN